MNIISNLPKRLNIASSTTDGAMSKEQAISLAHLEEHSEDHAAHITENERSAWNSLESSLMDLKDSFIDFKSSIASAEIISTHPDFYGRPWSVMKQNANLIPKDTHLMLKIVAGNAYYFTGYLFSNGYGSFIGHTYTSGAVYHVFSNTNTWCYQLLNMTNATEAV